MSKSSSPRALQELMTAVDAGHAVDSASSDSRELILGSGRRRSTYYKKSSRALVMEATCPSEASFEFSAVVSYSSASPASMVFSEGQLRAHQFPAVRSSAATSQATSPAVPVRGKQPQAEAAAGSKKRVSFATDGAAAAGKAGGGGGQGKKSGGLLGCMASACGSSSSSTDQAVEPVARNANRKVAVAVAF